MENKTEKIREKLLDMDPDKLQLMGHQTRAVAMAMIRSAIDMMIHSDLDVCSKSENEEAQKFAKYMKPLVKDWDTDEMNNVFSGVFNVFSKEPEDSRMSTIEDALHMIFDSIAEFGAGAEVAKEVAANGLEAESGGEENDERS